MNYKTPTVTASEYTIFLTSLFFSSPSVLSKGYLNYKSIFSHKIALDA